MKYFACFMLFCIVMAPGWAQRTREVSVESLIYDLKNPDPQRRKEAAKNLGQNKIHAAVPALVEAVKDSDSGVRLEVMRALVTINDPRALSAYVEGSGDPVEEIREKSIAGMVNLYVVEESGFIQKTRKLIDLLNPFAVDYDLLVVEPYVPVSPDAIAALSDLVSAPETGIRRKAAQALGVLRGEEAAPLLIDQLEREGDSGVKLQIIRALAKFGRPDYGASVIPFIEDPDKAVHDEAIRTVGLLRIREALDPLTRLYNSGPEERRKIFKIIPASGKDDLQFKLLDALAYIGAPASQAIFSRDLHHRDPEFRRAAAEGLARMALDPSGDYPQRREESRVLLAEQKQQETALEVLLAIHYALYRWGDEALLTELINGLDSPRYDQALQYLVEFSSQEASKLFPFVRLNRKKVQLGVLTALGMIGGADARQHLQEMSRDRDSEIASAANEALRRLNARVH